MITRAVSAATAERMRAFGSPTVVNPFDRFGDHLRIALRAPASYQLMIWLESGPGAPLPPRGSPPSHGHWVMCGYGRFGREVAFDLRAEGLHVTVVEPRDAGPSTTPTRSSAAATTRWCWRRRGSATPSASSPAPTTTPPTSRWSSAARRANPKVFVAARQNKAASAPLFDAVHVDSLLVPADVVAHEVYAQLATPLLWRFLQEVPRHDDAWAAAVVDRLMSLCGEHLQAVWKVRLTAAEAPAVQGWLAAGGARLGDLLRDPDDREERLHAVPLLLARGDGGADVVAPDDDAAARAGRRAAAGGLAGGAAAARLHADLRRDARVRPARPPRPVELGLAHAHPPPGLRRRATSRWSEPSGRSGNAGAPPCVHTARRGSRRRVGRGWAAVTGTGTGRVEPGPVPPHVAALCREYAALAAAAAVGLADFLDDVAALAVRMLPTARSARIRVRDPEVVTAVADGATRRGRSASRGGAPRAVLAIPLVGRGDLAGVLELAPAATASPCRSASWPRCSPCCSR